MARRKHRRKMSVRISDKDMRACIQHDGRSPGKARATCARYFRQAIRSAIREVAAGRY